MHQNSISAGAAPQTLQESPQRSPSPHSCMYGLLKGLILRGRGEGEGKISERGKGRGKERERRGVRKSVKPGPTR